MRTYTLVVTCCEHPDDEYDWIPGAVWSCSWGAEDPDRSAVQMISQTVPLSEQEPPRYITDWEEGKAVIERVRSHDGKPYRERIRESCSGCGATLTMRDDTWNDLSKALEGIEGLWRPMYIDDGWDAFEATISLAMLKRLAEEMRSRRGQPGQA